MDARQSLGTCALKLRRNFAGIKSLDVLLPVKRDELTTELRPRVVATAEPATAQLLAHLGLRLPRRWCKVRSVDFGALDNTREASDVARGRSTRRGGAGGG